MCRVRAKKVTEFAEECTTVLLNHAHPGKVLRSSYWLDSMGVSEVDTE